MTELDPADTVPVPRSALDELRICLTNHVETACMCIDAARALVDVADSPPVDEACTCGESVPTATTPGPCYWAENAPGVQSQVHCPPTAPSPSTREPVPTQLTDEERGRLLCDVACEGKHSRYCAAAMPDIYRVEIDTGDLIERVESLLAARLSASTDRAERAEAERDEAKRRALSAANERDEQRRMKEGNITALNKACAERDALAAKLEAVKRLAKWELGQTSTVLKSEIRESVQERCGKSPAEHTSAAPVGEPLDVPGSLVESIMRPPNPPVPVNDEAEAAWQAHIANEPRWYEMRYPEIKEGFLAGFSARPSVTVDEITELLAGHEKFSVPVAVFGSSPYAIDCDCGLRIVTDPMNSKAMRDAHRAHQASVIVAHITGEGE